MQVSTPRPAPLGNGAERKPGGLAASRYALAVLVTAAAAGLRLALTPILGASFPTPLLFGAILLSAWYGGLGPGVLSTLLSILITAVLWIHPVGSLAISDEAELGGLVLAGGVGTWMATSAAKVRRSEARERQERRNAELYSLRVRRLQELTAEVSVMLDLGGIAEAASRRGAAMLGADVAIVAMSADGQGARLEILHATGASDASLRQWRESDAGAPSALLFPVRTGRAYVLEAMNSEEPAATDEGGVIAVPLRRGAGPVIGAVAFGFPRRRVIVEELELAKSIAAECALAMDRASLFQAERDSRARAERAVVAHKDLLAVVSHDLRNPLGVILMGSERIARSAAGDLHKEAERMRRAASRMNVLITDLLDAASLEAGAFKVVSGETVGVRALVQEAVESLGSAAAQRSIVIEQNVVDDVDVVCDRGRVLQVLGNLLGNAVKFTPDGGTIDIRARSTSEDVEIAVADTGPGIPEAEIPHLFDRYFRGRRQPGSGSGLGLFISKGIVEGHGGHMAVESCPGRGTTFRFTLPRGRERSRKPSELDPGSLS